MKIIKVGINKYINVDRITYVEPVRKNRLMVHFAIGGGDVGGPSCRIRLEEDEAASLLRWLEGQSQTPQS